MQLLKLLPECTIPAQRVPVKQKLKTFLQPRILLEKFQVFIVQLRHFAGEKIARIANRVRAIGLTLLQLRVLCLGFLQDRDIGVGVFPEGEEILICGASLTAGCDAIGDVKRVCTGQPEIGQGADGRI
jgi:hypothetical protein